MRSLRRMNLWFWLAIAAYVLMSASILLMPLTQSVSGTGGRVIIILIGAMFWLFMLGGGAFVYFAERERKRIVGRKNTWKKGNLPGVITFFDNPIAALCDTVFIASVAAFVVIIFSDLRYQYVSYLFLFLLILSLSMHCIFNGRIYKTIKQSVEGERKNV